MGLKFAPKKSLSSQLSKSPTVTTQPLKVAAKPSSPAKSLTVPLKGIPQASKAPTSKLTVAPLKTTLERPVLRAFECLVHVEHALKSLQGVGAFVGEDAEKQRALTEQINQDLIQLHLSYKTYWKQVAISTGEKE